MEACSTGQTESLRLIVLDSSNQIISLAGSGLKTEEEHLNIKTNAALLICNACTPLRYLEMCNMTINNLRLIAGTLGSKEALSLKV